jgi:hypothetical protein
MNGGIGVESEGERPIGLGSDRVMNGGIGVESEGERPITPTPKKSRSLAVPVSILIALIGFGLWGYDWNVSHRWQKFRGTYKYSCPKFADGFRQQLGKNVEVSTLEEWPDLQRRATFWCSAREPQNGRVGWVEVDVGALQPFLDRVVAPSGAKPVDLGVEGEGYVFQGLIDTEVRTTNLPARMSTLVWRCQDRRMIATLYDYTKNGKRTDVEGFARNHVNLLQCDVAGSTLGPLPQALDGRSEVAVDTTDSKNSCPDVTVDMVKALSGETKLKTFELDFWSLDKYPQSGIEYKCTIYRFNDENSRDEAGVIELKFNDKPEPASDNVLAWYRSRADDEFSLSIPGNGFTLFSDSDEQVVWVCDKGTAEVSVRRTDTNALDDALRVLPVVAGRLGCEG